jgi:L-ascorbate metabolism protein UlaG (beta-lactamase superfamily)
MHLQFIRSATFLLHYAQQTILVDPMLNPAGAVDPVANTPNQRRNPLVELPFDDETLHSKIVGINGVLVTHLHNDHWDARATELLPKSLPILCQPEDEARIRERGFAEIQPIIEQREWRGIGFTRTAGQHGSGEIGRLMAPVSGFALHAPGEPTLYIAGDTIWCTDVAEVLQRDQPAVTVVNSGGARFLTGDPITMTAEDVVQVCRAAPRTRVIATHLEAINHCLVTRADLRDALVAAGVSEQVLIPADGQWLDLSAGTQH